MPYDFRRPNKFHRDHVRALQIANETFARQCTTTLSTTLQSLSQVSLAEVRQSTYDECIREFPNPSYLALVGLEPLSGASILHLPLPLAFACIDRLLGGQGTDPGPERPLTEIEQAVIHHLLQRIMRELGYAYESLRPVTPKILHQESNPHFAQIASPGDMAIESTFEVRLGNQEGLMSLITPFSTLQPVLDEISERSLQRGRVLTDPHSARNAVGDRLTGAPLEVAVRFSDVSLTSGEVAQLRCGDIVPLHHPTAAPLTVTVAGAPYYTASLGRRGKRLAAVLLDPLCTTAARTGTEDSR